MQGHTIAIVRIVDHRTQPVSFAAYFGYLLVHGGRCFHSVCKSGARTSQVDHLLPLNTFFNVGIEMYVSVF
jgi:hypothetical protein